MTNPAACHSLLTARIVELVPLGFEALEMPFRKPQFLTLGDEGVPARLYLSEEGLPGFIELSALEPGAWGNEIAISARESGPAMYDLCIVYQGAVFENARTVVRGEPPAALVQDQLQPGAIGILQAKAAGVQAGILRDRAE